MFSWVYITAFISYPNPTTTTNIENIWVDHLHSSLPFNSINSCLLNINKIHINFYNLNPSSFRHTPTFLGAPLTNTVSLDSLLSGVSIAMHCICPNKLSRFSLILSLIDPTSNFRQMYSFLTYLSSTATHLS